MTNPTLNTGTIFYSEVINNNLLYSDAIYPTSNYVSNQGSSVTVSSKKQLINEYNSPNRNSIYDTITVLNPATSLLLAYTNITPINLTQYDAIIIYLKSSINILTGNLSFVLNDSNNFNSPLETIFIPELLTNTWQRVVLKLNNPWEDISISCVGIKMEIDIGEFILNIYQPRIMKELAGSKQFLIIENIDEIETTNYNSLRTREYVPAFSGTTANIQGHKEEKLPFKSQTKYLFGFSESNAIGEVFTLQGFCTEIKSENIYNELIKYNYIIQSTDLHIPLGISKEVIEEKWDIQLTVSNFGGTSSASKNNYIVGRGI